MHLVDDVHALFDRGRGENGLLSQGADVVHTVVRGGVELHHVHHGTLGDAAAGGAVAAGVAVHRVFAVDGLRQDARAGGLAGAARADEDIGVGEPSGFYLVFQRLGDVALPDDLVKGLGAPLPIQRLIQAEHLRPCFKAIPHNPPSAPPGKFVP